MVINRYFFPFYREQETFDKYLTHTFLQSSECHEIKIFLTLTSFALLSSAVASNIIAANLGDKIR